ncbi:MAG: hypothetical protein IKB42_03650 [Clostridia bacterium]|nr:hypothetical protein [Clostridia bacterium]
MATFKKTIVLSNTTNPTYNGSAILTLTKESNSVYGTFKTFNVSSENNLVLGISENGRQVLKQNISLINNNIYNFKLNNIELDHNISCVLVVDEPDKVIPLCWGSDSKNQATLDIVDNLNRQKETATTTQATNIDLSQMFENTTEEIEEVVSKELDLDIFENNETKNNSEFVQPQPITDIDNTYSANFNIFNQKNESISKILSNKNIIDQEMENLNITDSETFYDNIAEQIEDLFSSYPAETNLEDLIPNSKWVKIDYENNGNVYVLGLIYEDISLKYICYGVPGEYSNTPPNGLDNYSQWLPTDTNNPYNNGYWVMYQNAITGESIQIDSI